MSHEHDWIEDTAHPDSGTGAEWFYTCGCGATKYVCIDQGKKVEEIEEAPCLKR